MLNLRSIIARQGDHRDAVARGDDRRWWPASIDLTVGYGIVLWHILAISLQTKYGVPWPVAVLVRARARRAGRLRQRGAGRDRADRRLHRDARHRHDPLCDRDVAQPGPPDRRRRARRLLSRSTGSFFFGLPITGYLCARAVARAVDRARISADRALFLRDRRQSEGGGAQRHSGAPLHHPRLRRPRAC